MSVPVTVLSVSFYDMTGEDELLDAVVGVVARWAEGQDIRTPVFTSETYQVDR